MKPLADYILQGRKQAIIVSSIGSLIPFMLSWLVAGMVVGLVTLRKGAKEGFLVLLWSALPVTVLAMSGYPAQLVGSVLCGTLLVWFFAIFLREDLSWLTVLRVALLLAMVGVILLRLCIPDVDHRWEVYFADVFNAAPIADLKESISPEVLKEFYRSFARLATGLFVASAFSNGLIILLVTRSWQAHLYNPGGLRKELYRLRLGMLEAGALVVCMLGWHLQMPLAYDVLPLLSLIFLAASMSLIHSVAASTQHGWKWLIFIYAALLLLSATSRIALYGALPLMLLAFLDCFINFRSRLGVLV